VLPEPSFTEVNGLRRALGDSALERIMPHLTLVPPVNVRVDDVGRALAVLRAAAAGSSPFTLVLGPVATFAPVNPVVYLSVTGSPPDGLQALHRLRDAVFAAPLERSLTFDFLPHVTLSTESSPDRTVGAVVALSDYRVEMPVDSVCLLQEVRAPDRRWIVMADAWLGPPAIVGRGGLEVELWSSSVADPEAVTLLGEPAPGLPAGALPLAVTARRGPALLGVATGWQRDGEAVVHQLAVMDDEPVDIERHLLAAFHARVGA
jgi:2'-5' RNA ligase